MDCALEWCDGELHRKECKNDRYGFWHCVTCHEPTGNNLQVTSHETQNPDHTMGWSCGEHLVVEPVT